MQKIAEQVQHLNIGDTTIADLCGMSWLEFRIQLSALPCSYRLRICGDQLIIERVAPVKTLKTIDFAASQMIGLNSGDQIVADIGEHRLATLVLAVNRARSDFIAIDDWYRGCIRFLKL